MWNSEMLSKSLRSSFGWASPSFALYLGGAPQLGESMAPEPGSVLSFSVAEGHRGD